MRYVKMMVVLVIAASALGACSKDKAEPTGTTVSVTLQEFAVVASAATAPAGSVTFNAENTGPDDEHEFVIVRTDLAIDALPTTADGIVDEAGEGVEIVDEIEGIAVGGSGSVTADLSAGAYVLICNILDAEGDAHYQKGMRSPFAVT